MYDFNHRTKFLEDIYAGVYTRPGFYCHPPARPVFAYPGGEYTLSDLPISEVADILERDYYEQAEFHEDLEDDGIPMARLMTGTQIYAHAFGAEVHTPADNAPFAKPMIFSAKQADAVEEPQLENCRNLMRIFELIQELKHRLGNDVPFLCPDMQTGFDTLSLLWDKSSLFCAMLDDDEREHVKQLNRKCAGFLKKFLVQLRSSAPNISPCHCPGTWTPPTLGPWVSNDECGSISTELFEEFCLPELIDLSATFGGLGMHCCAAAEHQFESFKKIPNFYGFNRVKASKGYLPILEHFSGVGSPVHALAWLDYQTIEELLEKAPAGTRFIFNLMGENENNSKEWLDRMHALIA